MMWLAVLTLVAQTRIASDFEIAQMKQQIARSRDFLSQLSGHLNLGDLYATRNEIATSRGEYIEALTIADRESLAARKSSDITRYATAVMYAALANAKLGNAQRAFEEAEEALRYTSASAKSWNLYASAMTILKRNEKAASAARRAVTIATKEVSTAPTIANRLDLAVYQYSLASSVDDQNESERLLRSVVDELRGNAFAGLRHDIARSESFEIYSSARGDEATYLSLLNRANLRLAGLLEHKGDRAAAIAEYARVLEARSDDATALAALARLTTGAEQERYFAAAFDANPFSMPLIRVYQQRHATNASIDESTTGGRVRAAIAALQRGETRAAREKLDALLRDFPNNETLRTLRADTEREATIPAFFNASMNSVQPSSNELRQLLDLLRTDKLTPAQRARLDALTFRASVVLDHVIARNGQTVVESGSIGDVRFRFSEPTAFTGAFADRATLTFRVLGATEMNGSDALLLEPLKLEQP